MYAKRRANAFAGEAGGSLNAVMSAPTAPESNRSSSRLSHQPTSRLKHRLVAENALAKVTGILVSAEKADLEEALAILGRTFGADRVRAIVFGPESDTEDRSREWCAPGMEPLLHKLRDLPSSWFRWGFGEARSGREVIVPDTADLPDEASDERESLLGLGVRSFLQIPTLIAGRLIGFLSLDYGHVKNVVPLEDVDLLRTASQVIAAYLDRKKAEEALHASETRLIYLSAHDDLTGAYNWPHFERLLGELNSAERMPLSLIMGDLNGLKLLNEAFGHQEGDSQLVRVSRILVDSCRPGDQVCRLGGDEFAVLMPNADAGEALRVCDRIREACAKPGISGLPVSIALGTATETYPAEDSHVLVKTAEERMDRSKLRENRSARHALISSLERSLWETSHETEEHARRLQQLALKVGGLLDMRDSELDELALVASLHDIGKIAIPDSILEKPGSLTREEWEIMKKHPEIGCRIAGASECLSALADAILSHHEWWDGSGYPQGLRGEEIPLTSRIVSIVDAYDAMTHGRPYRRPVDPEEAFRELRRCAGSQFEGSLVDIFVKEVSAEARIIRLGSDTMR